MIFFLNIESISDYDLHSLPGLLQTVKSQSFPPRIPGVSVLPDES